MFQKQHQSLDLPDQQLSILHQCKNNCSMPINIENKNRISEIATYNSLIIMRVKIKYSRDISQGLVSYGFHTILFGDFKIQSSNLPFLSSSQSLLLSLFQISSLFHCFIYYYTHMYIHIYMHICKYICKCNLLSLHNITCMFSLGADHLVLDNHFGVLFMKKSISFVLSISLRF